VLETKQTNVREWRICKTFQRSLHDEDVRALNDEVKGETLPYAATQMGINPLCDVSGTAGPTGCDPTQTAVFQLLDIPTRSKLCRVLLLSGRKKKSERPGSTVYEVQYHTFVWRWRCPSCEVLQFEDEMIETGKASAHCRGQGYQRTSLCPIMFIRHSIPLHCS